MINMRTSLKIVSTVCFISLLASCGGGGGGSSSGSGGSSGSDLTACLNFSAPSPPTLNYSGNTSAATLDKTDAPPMAARSMQLILQLENVIPTLPQDVTVSQESCFNNQTSGTSGALKGTTLIQTNRSGWSNFQYNNYTGHIVLGFLGNTYSINGTAYATFIPTSSNKNQVNVTIWLINYHVVIPTYMDITLNGTINVTGVRTQSNGPFNNQTPVDANIVITDNLNNTTTWAHNYQYSDTTSTSIPQFDYSRTLSGRIYDSNMGYADITTINPIWYYSATPSGGYPFQYSDGGGPIKFTGSSPSIAFLTPLNPKLLSVAIDSGGNGLLTTAERLNWADLQPDTTPWPNLTGPVPIAAVDQMTSALVVDQPMPLEGLRSYDPAGGFITYNWSETFAPPGSTATLTNTTSATPSFTPDVPGDYRFKLTVSNGISSNSDEIVVTVLAAPTNIITFGNTGVTGPNLEAHVGQTVTLDSRASRDYVPGLVDNPDIGYSWTLVPPPGSNAQLSYPSSDASIAQFIPDIPGFYLADLEANTSIVSSPIITQQVIAVDTPVNFQKLVTLRYAQPTDNPPSLRFVTGDFNDDGISDIAIISDLVNPTLQVFYGTAQGSFSAPTSIPLASNGNFTYMVAKDINNDGRTDIVIGGSGTYVLLQKSDGTLAAPEQIAANSTCGSLLLAIGPWEAATTNSIYTIGGGCVDIYNYTSGQFTSSGTFPFTDLDIAPLAEISSVTGDNLADMLVLNEADINNPTLDVFAGQSDGSFVKQNSYLLTGAGGQLYGQTLVTGDFNHDGLQDVAAIAGNNVDVLLQNGSGSFSSIVQYPLFGGVGGIYTIGGLSAGDINNDGFTDLITQHFGYQFSDPNNTNNVFYVSYLGIFLQNASQTLNSELLYPFSSSLSPNTFINSTQISDLNGDGLPDVVMFNGNGNLVILYQK